MTGACTAVAIGAAGAIASSQLACSCLIRWTASPCLTHQRCCPGAHAASSALPLKRTSRAALAGGPLATLWRAQQPFRQGHSRPQHLLPSGQHLQAHQPMVSRAGARLSGHVLRSVRHAQKRLAHGTPWLSKLGRQACIKNFALQAAAQTRLAARDLVAGTGSASLQAAGAAAAVAVAAAAAMEGARRWAQ